MTFVLERNIGEAAEDVREKVSQAMRKLPPNVLPPTVAKADPDSDPVITLAVSGNRPVRELTEIADKQIRRAIETVDGVGGVDINGGRYRQINVFLDLDKLNAYNLSAQDVNMAVQTENIEAPGGRIVRGPTELGVRTLGRVEHVEEFNNIIVKNVGGAPIRLRDVGLVEDGMAEKRTFAYYNGKPAVMLDVRRQTGTNTVKVVDRNPGKAGTSSTSTLPPGVKIDVVKEQATYIKASVAALEEHLLLGSLLASFIVWLFIRDWRMVLISSIAIPTSIITTFTVHADDGLHAELDDAAGADAGRGHRDRRRHHCSREYLPVHRREGHAADAGGDRGDERNRAGGDCDDDLAGHHLRADRLHVRLCQAFHESVRLDDGDLDPGLDAGGVYA